MSEREDIGPCLELDVGHDGYGYAVIYPKELGGKQIRAHRYAWIKAHGPIPSKTLVCHKCDNPACSRLSHLFAGSHKDNSQDMARKGRTAWRGKSLPEEARRKMSAAKKGVPKTAAQNEANRQGQLRRWAAKKATSSSTLTPAAA